MWPARGSEADCSDVHVHGTLSPPAIEPTVAPHGRNLCCWHRQLDALGMLDEMTEMKLSGLYTKRKEAVHLKVYLPQQILIYLLIFGSIGL
jgi:hypothetical protein